MCTNNLNNTNPPEEDTLATVTQLANSSVEEIEKGVENTLTVINTLIDENRKLRRKLDLSESISNSDEEETLTVNKPVENRLIQLGEHLRNLDKCVIRSNFKIFKTSIKYTNSSLLNASELLVSRHKEEFTELLEQSYYNYLKETIEDEEEV